VRQIAAEVAVAEVTIRNLNVKKGKRKWSSIDIPIVRWFFARKNESLGCMYLTIVIHQFCFIIELLPTFTTLFFPTKKIELHSTPLNGINGFY
jgi:hypothetical protein